jgi:hypothetical protein
MSYETPVRRADLVESQRRSGAPRTRPLYRLHSPPAADDAASDSQWQVFASAIHAVRAGNMPLAIGGGLAISLYTGYWRPSKDIDLYVLATQRQSAIDAMLDAGFSDYHDQAPYDRAWLFRGIRSGVIVDIMWALANGAGEVGPDWMERGIRAELHGESLQLLAPEELLWSKIHVLQRDRCDWPDLLNLLYATGPQWDWQRLFQRLEGHQPLLAALLSLFAWVAPGRAGALPRWVWSRLQLARRGGAQPARCDERIRLLDSRPWFTDADIRER